LLDDVWTLLGSEGLRPYLTRDGEMPVDVPQAAQGQPQLPQLLTEFRAQRTAHIALRARSKYRAPGNGAPAQAYCNAAEEQDMDTALLIMWKYLTKEDKSAVRMTTDSIPRGEEYLPAVWKAMSTLYSVVGPAERLRAEKDLLFHEYRETKEEPLKAGNMKTFLDKALVLRNAALSMQTQTTNTEFLVLVITELGQTLEYKTEYNNVFERLTQNPPDPTVTWMSMRQMMVKAEAMRVASKSRAKRDSDDSDKQSEDEEESAQAAWHRGADREAAWHRGADRSKGRGRGGKGGAAGGKGRGGFAGGAARGGGARECFDFRDTGKCAYGDKCRFEHDGRPAGGSRCKRCDGKGHEVDVCPSAP
jgi:uncharacterized membrane protein YgcG